MVNGKRKEKVYRGKGEKAFVEGILRLPEMSRSSLSRSGGNFHTTNFQLHCVIII